DGNGISWTEFLQPIGESAGELSVAGETAEGGKARWHQTPRLRDSPSLRQGVKVRRGQGSAVSLRGAATPGTGRRAALAPVRPTESLERTGELTRVRAVRRCAAFPQGTRRPWLSRSRLRPE